MDDPHAGFGKGGGVPVTFAAQRVESEGFAHYLEKKSIVPAP